MAWRLRASSVSITPDMRRWRNWWESWCFSSIAPPPKVAHQLLVWREKVSAGAAGPRWRFLLVQVVFQDVFHRFVSRVAAVQRPLAGACRRWRHTFRAAAAAGPPGACGPGPGRQDLSTTWLDSRAKFGCLARQLSRVRSKPGSFSGGIVVGMGLALAGRLARSWVATSFTFR
jgi:hypothetical protein